MNQLYAFAAHLTLGLVGWGFALSPRPLRNFYASSIGFVLRKLKFRRKVIESNLKRARDAWPQGTLKPIDDQVVEVYSRLGSLFLEITLVFGGMKYFVSKATETRGLENIDRAKSKGRAILYLTSHLGNWEIMVASAADAAVDFLMVTKRLKPSWLHELVESCRKSYGVTATYEPKTLKDVLKWLKNKRGVGFILDQYAGPPIGVRVPFFGTYVGTSSALATLVRRTNACVVPVMNYKDASGVYVTEFYPELEWIESEDLHEEICLNTAQYSEFIEERIRKYPSQWLWTHRRFKGELGPLKVDEWKSGRSRGDKNPSLKEGSSVEMTKN